MVLHRHGRARLTVMGMARAREVRAGERQMHHDYGHEYGDHAMRE
jgi:hypothetical protein